MASVHASYTDVSVLIAVVGLVLAISGCSSSPGRAPFPPQVKRKPDATPPPATTPEAPPAPARETQPAPPARPSFRLDVFVSPDGTGTRDGSNRDNALPGSKLAEAWARVKPGGACALMSGIYENVTLKIDSGGTGPQTMKYLVGVDTGNGIPVFQGTWRRQDKSKGTACLRIEKGVSYLEVRGVEIRNYREGVYTSTKAGRNVGLRLSDIHIRDSRDAMTLCGGATDDDLAVGSHDIVVRGCRFLKYTKRGLRIRGGCYDVAVVDCVADMGGADYFTESFPIGFNVMGNHGVPDGSKVTDHDITFVNCEARNNHHPNGKNYWNADGFCSERTNYAIRYYRCRSMDNTDGGWDDKARDVAYVDCVALRNKRNYRIWTTERAVMVNCVGAYAFKRGGSGGAAGLWTNGTVRVMYSTFHDNVMTLDRRAKGKPCVADVTLRSCILSRTSPGSVTSVHAGGKLRTEDTATWVAGTQGDNPDYVNARRSWDGIGDAFDSKRHGEAKGYHASNGPSHADLRAIIAHIKGRAATAERD